MVIQAGHTVTNTADVNVKDVTVETGGTLVLNNGTNFRVHGTTADIDGTLTANDNSTVLLLSSAATSLTGTGTKEFFNLTVNTDAGTTLSLAIRIRGTLQLEDGTFNTTGGSVLLASSATRTGRLGQVASGAAYSGNLTMERYIPAGATNWRLLGSAVSGGTVADWNDDFFTAGFPGSDYPPFYVNGDLWPSVRWYDETNTGTTINDGLVGVSSTAQVLSTGQGFAVWSGDNLGGTAAFTIDVTGPPNVAASPITLPMTWTSTGNAAVDGWNLVSNPLPSAISFDAISRGANVNNEYNIYNPANGNNANWNGTVGTNGANGTIQSSQGFWLKATGSSVTTTVSESAKTNSISGGIFGGMGEQLPMLRLAVSSAINTFKDECVVVFQDGTPAYEPGDSYKFIFAHPEAPQLYTRSTDAVDLAISMFGAYDTDVSIPFVVDVPITGTYTLTASDMEGLGGLTCLVLEDLQTGAITPLANEAAYSFSINANDDITTPRFVVHASAPHLLSTTDLLCNGDADGTATLVVNGTAAEVSWNDGNGVPMETVTNASGELVLGDLAAGSYEVRVSSDAGCGMLVEAFTITQPAALEGTIGNAAASCPGTTDGQLSLEVTGGVAPYTYAWSTGSTDASITVGAGTYSVLVTDANGCERIWEELIVTEGVGPDAAFSIPAEPMFTNTPVQFTDASTLAEGWYWEFGDGEFSEEASPEHTYLLPGTYTVVLYVYGNNCYDSGTMDIDVQLSTGLEAASHPGDLRVWSNGQQFVLDQVAQAEGSVVVEILDATGRLHQQHQLPASPGRTLLPAERLTTGIWFVRVTGNSGQRTFRVPLVR